MPYETIVGCIRDSLAPRPRDGSGPSDRGQRDVSRACRGAAGRQLAENEDPYRAVRLPSLRRGAGSSSALASTAHTLSSASVTVFLPCCMAIAQAAAAYVDLGIMESQRPSDSWTRSRSSVQLTLRWYHSIFPSQARTPATVSTSRPRGARRSTSLFRVKRIEVNRVDETLLDLLLLFHGEPGKPSATLPVNCPHDGCGARTCLFPARAVTVQRAPARYCRQIRSGFTRR